MLIRLLPVASLLSRGNFIKVPARFLHVEIPFLPAQIDLPYYKITKNEIDLNLLNLDQVSSIKHKLRNAKDGKYNKWRDLPAFGIKCDYSIIKNGNVFHALYHGQKYGKCCGIGSLGVAKYAQNIENGEWDVAKIQSAGVAALPERIEHLRKINNQEYDILKKMDVALGTFERVSPGKGFQTVTLMRLVHGRTLIQYLHFLHLHRRSISLSLAINIAKKICEELDWLHDKHRLAHKDLHHGNVLYDQSEDKVKLIDFGSSKEIDKLSENSDMRDAGILIKSLWSEIFEKESPIKKDINKIVKRRLISTFDDESERLTAKEGQEYFEAMERQLADKAKHEGIFHLGLFQKSTSEEKRKMLHEMRQFDRVSLEDHKKRHVIEYVSIKRELEERQGIPVKSTVTLK